MTQIKSDRGAYEQAAFPPPKNRGELGRVNVPNQCTMPHPTHPVRVTVLFAAVDYGVFVCATRQLRRIMGRTAPGVIALIQFNLQGRDATGIADDYLDAIRWPNAAGRVISLRGRRKRNSPNSRSVCFVT